MTRRVGVRETVVLAVAVLVASVAVLAGRAGTPTPEPAGDVATADVAPIPRLEGAVRAAVAPESRTDVVPTPDARVAMRVVELLAGIGPREAGSDADEVARVAIAQELREAGWTTTEETFPLPQGGRSANVVAWRGDERPSEPYLLLGAHHDTVPGSPGANDNASGVGVLVAVAHRLADVELPVPVVLVAFGAEERQPTRDHHVGSEAYAAAHADGVAAMVSVDMVGNSARRGPHCACWMRGTSRELADRLVEIGAEVGAPVTAEAAGEVSDHAPFARRGVPAVLLWSGPDPRWHTPGDTAEHVRGDDLRRAAAIVTVLALAGG